MGRLRERIARIVGTPRPSRSRAWRRASYSTATGPRANERIEAAVLSVWTERFANARALSRGGKSASTKGRLERLAPRLVGHLKTCSTSAERTSAQRASSTLQLAVVTYFLCVILMAVFVGKSIVASPHARAQKAFCILIMGRPPCKLGTTTAPSMPSHES